MTVKLPLRLFTQPRSGPCPTSKSSTPIASASRCTDKDGKAPADFDAQCALVFANIGAALASQGAGFANLIEFTTYLVHSQDIPAFMAYRTREFPKLFAGGAYPPNTLLIVDRLVQEQFLIEVSAVAAL
jgi:enamine deaminase RidA (YjgF/YER057c/UK114 family)